MLMRLWRLSNAKLKKRKIEKNKISKESEER